MKGVSFSREFRALMISLVLSTFSWVLSISSPIIGVATNGIEEVSQRLVEVANTLVEELFKERRILHISGRLFIHWSKEGEEGVRD